MTCTCLTRYFKIFENVMNTKWHNCKISTILNHMITYMYTIKEDHSLEIKIHCTVDWLVFNANISNISATSWRSRYYIVHLTSINLQKKILINPFFKWTFFLDVCKYVIYTYMYIFLIINFRIFDQPFKKCAIYRAVEISFLSVRQ